MNTVLQKRDMRIDILKGIGILLMVFGHAGCPGSRFIYLFHMPIFFMATGYLYKDKNTDSLGSVAKYIGKRVKTLWLPYVLADTIYNLLNNLFRALHIYAGSALKMDAPWGGTLMVMPTRELSASDIWNRFLNALRFQGSAEFGMAMWFLQALFGVTILFVLIDYILRQLTLRIFKSEKARQYSSDVLMGVIAVLLLLAGVYVSKNHVLNLNGFEKSLICFILMYLGRMIHRYIRPLIENRFAVTIVLGLIGFVGLYIANSHGRIELSANQITGPAFFVTVSVLGWFFIYAISTALEKVPAVGKALTIFGQNTLAIVIMHFLAFRIVSAIVVCVYALPIEAMGATPVITSHGAWWLAYGIVGAVVPTIVNDVRKKLSAKLFSSVE